MWCRAWSNLEPTTQIADADVTIEIGTCSGAASIACWTGRRESELATATITIEEPPVANGLAKIWTDKFVTWRSQPDIYEYLRGTLLHEFGHALGLWDAYLVPQGTYVGIMRGQNRVVPPGLSTDDENALKAIYQNHVRH